MNQLEKLYLVNTAFNSIIKKRKKTISLFLNWQDKKSYIGEGKILEMLDFTPIVFLDNPSVKNTFIYFRPRRCLCEIVESKFYDKGFKKHFIIPFKIPQKQAEELIPKEERKYNTPENNIKTNVIITALNFNNSLVDSIEEIEFSRQVLHLYKKQKITDQNLTDIKEQLNKNLELRQKNIDDTFDRLYPDKAKKLKRLKKRNYD